MLLEEILPEIRKGRRVKNKLHEDYFIPMPMMLDESWELEPLKKEISRDDLAKAWIVSHSHSDVKEVIFSTLCRILGL